MTLTAGVDVGNGAVKAAVADDGRVLAKSVERIRRRDPDALARAVLEDALAQAGAAMEDAAYVGSTGEGYALPFATGHFYSMTAHARGAVHLAPGVGAVLDVGALHGRAMAVDGRGKVLDYRMTSQCASGSGQFLENIARHLGIGLDEIGPLSLEARGAEPIGGVCAVLAETDVINMVSAKTPLPEILGGIHAAMASRLVRLLEALGAREGEVLVTGGLGRDIGLLAALNEAMHGREVKVAAKNHPDSIFAGAIGAALWGEFRHGKLARTDKSRGGSETKN